LMPSQVNRTCDTVFHARSASCIMVRGYHRPLPPLDPGTLPPAYFTLGESWHDGHSSMRDPDIEKAGKASSSMAVPAPPIPPPELTKSGKPLTKKQKKEVSVLHYSMNYN
jgi:hypothetical protein